MQYKGAKRPLPQIAQELNVDAVIEGSVLRAGDRVRITAQLIGAVPERHLWARNYERDLRDVLSLQGEIARAIADEIKAKVTPDVQARLARARPVNPEAFDAYTKGRYYLNSWTPEGVGKAIGLFNRALERDPGYALAYAGLAEAYELRMYSGKDAGAQKARDAAVKAVALDETLAEAHACLGLVCLHFDWDWSAAEGHLRRAVELNPNSAEAHDYYALYLLAMRRFEEALRHTQRSHEMDPLSPTRLALHGSVFYYLGQYDHALEEWRSAVEMSPESPLAHSSQGFAYLQKGMN
jgi:adenylate cyclase